MSEYVYILKKSQHWKKEKKATKREGHRWTELFSAIILVQSHRKQAEEKETATEKKKQIIQTRRRHGLFERSFERKHKLERAKE